MARSLTARGLGATSAPAPTLTLVPPADVWAVPTVELDYYLTETAEQLARLVGPLHAALSGRQPALPPVDQIDCALLALGVGLDGVKHWRSGGCPVSAPIPEPRRRALWEAHDAACTLLPRLKLVAVAHRASERRPWLQLSQASIADAFGALDTLGLLPVLPSARLLQAWREAQDGVALDVEAGEP